MRQSAHAHGAVIAFGADEDERAPGGAITVELCGHWEHEGPCPLAEHHTGAERDGDTLRLLVRFDTEPEKVDEVRTRIRAALAAKWTLLSDGSAPPG